MLSQAYTMKAPLAAPKWKSGSNWTCKSCMNSNLPDRDVCNRCKDPRARSQWHCQSCGNWNWLDREACNICKMAPFEFGESFRKRPRHEGFMEQGRSMGANWSCKSCGNQNYPDRVACNRCKADRGESQWLCGACENWNYADRQECNRCQAPPLELEQGVSQEQIESDSAAVLQAIQAFNPQFTGDQYFCETGYNLHGLLKELGAQVVAVRARHNPKSHFGHAMHRAAPVWEPQQGFGARYEPRQPPMHVMQRQAAGPVRVQEKPGSWECVTCSNWNFPDREECNRCKAPKRVSAKPYRQADVARKPGSWLCSICPNQWNFPDREICNKCKNARAEVEAVV